MRRVRLANVATTTTALRILRRLRVQRCRILPFTTSTRSWKTDGDQLDDIENLRASWKPSDPLRYNAGDILRRTPRWYDSHIEKTDTILANTKAVATPEEVLDEAASSKVWRNALLIHRQKFHRRVIQSHGHLRQAEQYPDSGVSFVSLSPPKGLQILPALDSFWNVNFAAMSAKYNLAYPAHLRVGNLFVFDAVAKRAFQILSEQPSSASNELEGMRQLWEGTAVFPTNEAKLHWWPTLMLWLLQNHPAFAAKFLLASYVEPYPPFYMVADSLEYLACYYLQSEEKHTLVEAEYFRALVYVLLDACTATAPYISQKTMFLLATHSSTEQVMYLHDMLHKAGIYIHPDTVLHFANVYAKDGEFRRALDTLEEAIVAGVDPLSDSFLATCNKILHCSVMHPDGYHASSYIVARFIDLGAEMNQRLYNVLIVNALAASDMPTALRVFSLLEENKVDPNPITYASLLCGYKKMDCSSPEFEATILQKAHDCSKRSKDAWLATEILHCSYLHHLKGENGQIRDPIAVFHSTLTTYQRYFTNSTLHTLRIHVERMGSSKVDLMDPTPAAINILLTSFLNAYPERALVIFNRFSSILRASAEEGFLCKTFLMIRELVMNDYTHNILLMALSQDSRNLQHCTTLVQQMSKGLPDALLPRHSRTNEMIHASQPTAMTWSILLHAFARHGQTAAAEKVMNLMRKRGLEPTKVTWNSLIKGYAGNQDVHGTVGALNRMEGEGFDADEYTTSTLKRIKDSEGLVTAWQEERDTGDEEQVLAADNNLKRDRENKRRTDEARQRVIEGEVFSDSPTA